MFRTTFPRLVSMGVIKTGQVDIARELAQETMLRAHERWDEIAGYESLEAWCHLVMANLLIDHYRSTASERRAIDRLEGSIEAISAPPVVERWNQLVAPLSDRQRMIVTLYYAQDWSVAEIADALATSSGAVKAALFKARRSLRRTLEGSNDG